MSRHLYHTRTRHAPIVARTSRGRPPLPDGQRLSKHLAVSFTDADYTDLISAAGNHGVNVQDWVRQAVRSSLKVQDWVSQAVRQSKATDSYRLTTREKEVARLIAEGHSNDNIAKILGVTRHTAKFHVNNVIVKMDADNRAQVAALAVKLGLA